MLCKKLPRKLKNFKRHCSLKRKILPKTTKIGRISCAAWSGITNSESIEWSATKIIRMIGICWRLKIFYDPDLLRQLWRPTFLIKLLLPRVQEKPSREVGMLRNTRENMSVLGNIFDCQHARRDPDELHNDSRNLATSLVILRREGIENSGERRTIAINTFHLAFSVRAKKRKNPDDK